MLEITNNIFICDDELTFKFSRSAGPGGQNVNKVNTRVTLLFDVPGCQSLSDSQKTQILNCLATRADKTGKIRVISQRHRTQLANRTAVVERLCQLLKAALEKKPPRKKTKIPYSARQKRLTQKKQRSALKQLRGKVDHQ